MTIHTKKEILFLFLQYNQNLISCNYKKIDICIIIFYKLKGLDVKSLLIHDYYEEVSDECIIRIPNRNKPVPVVIICTSEDSIAFSYTGEQFFSKKRVANEDFYDHLSMYLIRAGFATIQKTSLDRSSSDPFLSAFNCYQDDKKWIKDALLLRYNYPQINPDKLFLFIHGFAGYIISNEFFAKNKALGSVFASCPYHPYEEIYTNNCVKIKQFCSVDPIKNAQYKEFDPVSYSLAKSPEIMYKSIRQRRTMIKVASGKKNTEVTMFPQLWKFKAGFYPFSMVRSPSLVIHGTDDLYIPLDEPFSLEQSLKSHLINVKRELITGGDHWFRSHSMHGVNQISEIITGEWNERPFNEKFFKSVIAFFKSILA